MDAPEVTDAIGLAGDENDLFWFSHFTKEYEVVKKLTGKKKFLIIEDKPAIKLEWDNCTISIARMLPETGLLRFVVRSNTNRNSDYMGNIPVKLRFMFGIDLVPSGIGIPRTESGYQLAVSKRRNLPESARAIVHDRWVFNLGQAEVWQWAKSGTDIRSSRLYALYQRIMKYLDNPADNGSPNIFRVRADKIDQVIPVIYQPSVDSLDNFLREVHCFKSQTAETGSEGVRIEVSLLFNNEQLRKFRLVDGLYRWLRRLIYGRMIDVETFVIHFVQDDSDRNYLIFKGIYSGDYNLEFDTIHGDKDAVEHGIEYYFMDTLHPIVFVNTSNHAMAEHDNNHELWKWEYVPWLPKAPVVLGTKSRRDIEREFRSAFG
ncbi:MAG: hypothetical protein ACRD99_06225 [Nitrososphaera sp.]